MWASCYYYVYNVSHSLLSQFFAITVNHVLEAGTYFKLSLGNGIASQEQQANYRNLQLDEVEIDK